MTGHMAERLWRQFQVHLIHLSRMKNSKLLVRKSEGSNPSVFINFGLQSFDHYNHPQRMLLRVDGRLPFSMSIQTVVGETSVPAIMFGAVVPTVGMTAWCTPGQP